LADIITSSTGYSDFALKLVGALREAVELDLEGADEREVRGEYATLQSHSSRSGACAVGQAARPRGQGVVSTGRLGKHKQARRQHPEILCTLAVTLSSWCHRCIFELCAQ